MTIVCITGMHRSGTSMVVRLLNLCGVYLGEDADVLSSDSDNFESLWENRKFLAINEEILTRLGAGWDFAPEIQPGWESRPEMMPLREQAAGLVRQFSAHKIWGWKDPRNSLTLPFWQQLVPGMRVVICLRNPIAVARSLFQRNYSSEASSFNLWLAYNSTLLGVTAPHDRIITHYDAYFHDPRAELMRILQFLEMNASRGLVDDAVRAVSLPLQHHRAKLLDLVKANAPQNVVELYKDMCSQSGPVYQRLPAEELVSPTEPGGGYVGPVLRMRLSDLEVKIVDKERGIRLLESQLAEKEQALLDLQELREMKGSRVWQIAMLLRRIRVLLFPPGSLRARVAGKLLAPREGSLPSDDLALIRDSALFDASWYLAQYPDVARSGMSPAFHYLQFGGFEGRDPGPKFSSSWYLATYQDVQQTRINPLIHYLKYGRNEARSAHPLR